MKKSRILILAGLVFSLAACTSQSNNSTGTNSQTNPIQSTTIPTSQPVVPTTAPTVTPTTVPSTTVAPTTIPSTTVVPEVDKVTFYDGENVYLSEEIKNGVITKPTDPIKDGYIFEGWYSNADLNEFSEFDFTKTNIEGNVNLYAKWNKCYTISFVTNMDGVTVNPISTTTVSSLPKPKCSGYSFLGWFIDSACYSQLKTGTKLTEDITLYARWEKAPEIGYELYEANLDVNNNLESGLDADNDIIVNGFKVLKTTEVRNRTYTWTDGVNTLEFIRSIKIDSNNRGVEFTIQGPTTLEMFVQNGSSGATTKDVLISNLSGGQSKKITISGTQAVKDDKGNVIYEAGSPICKVVVELDAGSYRINRDTGTLDLYYLRLTSTLERSKEVGFEITNPGTVEFFEGQNYKISGMIISSIYANGRINELDLNNSNLTIDYSSYKKEAGVYTISVTYKTYETQTFDVVVYSVDEINLYFDKTYKSSQNSIYDNGVYVAGKTKEIYAIGQEFDSSNLTVKIITTNPVNGTQKEFKLLNGYTIDTSLFDNTKAGTYDINVGLSFKDGINKSFSVIVIDKEISMVNDIAQVCVDCEYDGELGVVVNGYNMFKTIQQALEYIENCKLDASTQKYLKIMDGLYTEKLEITIPNLTIEGESKENTIIEYDSLYGITDSAGFVHTTDSTQTVAVRDSALRCTIKNITISNYWNSQERFDKDLGENYSEHRALALLVQSDMFIMDNCKLLGYQDTLELFTGRQYITNTYICGITDFIFGTNNTTYFYQCEIRSIAGKNGYVTAFKGMNKTTDDAILYGAIFDSCDFTCDIGVDEGKTALGRTWGACATVMFMNCNLGSHISTGLSNGSTPPRYVSMNCDPGASTVKFTEYNNSGDGAITESTRDCDVLTEAEAANYNNIAIIFGTTNGGVTYETAWDPTK